MAIYSLAVKSVSRTTGRSSVAAAAYRAGPFAGEMINARDGETHDYSRRRGVEDAFVLTPDGCEWAQDRSALWNAAEAAENRRDAKTAREYVLALPSELNAAGRLDLVTQFGNEVVTRFGVAADIAIHEPSAGGDRRNFHAHVLTTTRSLSPDGLGPKTRALDVAKEAGPHIEALRAVWEKQVNAALERVGSSERVNHLSYRRQGTDQEPQWHMGVAATAMERRGEQTELGNHNRQVAATNEASASLRAELSALEATSTRIERQAASERRVNRMRGTLGLDQSEARVDYAGAALKTSDAVLKALGDPSMDRFGTFTFAFSLTATATNGYPDPARAINVIKLMDTAGVRTTALEATRDGPLNIRPVPVEDIMRLVAATPAEDRADLIVAIGMAGQDTRQATRYRQAQREAQAQAQARTQAEVAERERLAEQLRTQAAAEQARLIEQQAKQRQMQAEAAAAAERRRLAEQKLAEQRRLEQVAAERSARLAAARKAPAPAVAAYARPVPSPAPIPAPAQTQAHAYLSSLMAQPRSPSPQDDQLRAAALNAGRQSTVQPPRPTVEAPRVDQGQATRPPVPQAASPRAPTPAPAPAQSDGIAVEVRAAVGLPPGDAGSHPTFTLTNRVRPTDRLHASNMVDGLAEHLSKSGVKFDKSQNDTGGWHTITVSVADLVRHLAKLGREQVDQWLRLLRGAAVDSREIAAARLKAKAQARAKQSGRRSGGMEMD